MRFRIEKNFFIDQLNIVSRAAATKGDMPALCGILVECSDNIMTLIASNKEISIKVTIDDPRLIIEEEGSCLIPGKYFSDIVKKSNGEQLEVEVDIDGVLRIYSGSTNAKLNLWDVEDYPNIRFDVSTQPIKIKGELLKELIRQTTFACLFTSTSDNTSALKGVNFRTEGSTIICTSSDRARISKREAELDEESPEVNAIVLPRILNELDKIVMDNDEELEMYFTESKLLVKTQNILFLSSLLNANYPDARKYSSTLAVTYLTFSKEELIQSIERVSLLSSNAYTSAVVKMHVTVDGEVILSSSSSDLGTIEDTFRPIEVTENMDFTIAFYAYCFLDALRAFKGDTVKIGYNERTRPIIFYYEEEEGLLELVQPLSSVN